MTNEELLAKINELTGEHYASLDEISYRQLMIIYINLLIAYLEQQGAPVEVHTYQRRKYVEQSQDHRAYRLDRDSEQPQHSDAVD